MGLGLRFIEITLYHMQNPDHDRQWFPVGRAVSLKVTISMPFTLAPDLDYLSE